MNRRGVFKTLLGGAVAAAGVSTTPALARSWDYDVRLHPLVTYDILGYRAGMQIDVDMRSFMEYDLKRDSND